MWLFYDAVYHPVVGFYEILESVDGDLTLKTREELHIHALFINNFNQLFLFPVIQTIQTLLVKHF